MSRAFTKERVRDPESHFRDHVFNASLDIVINQLLKSFVALCETSELFQARQPSELDSATDDALYEQPQLLADHYNRDISPCFPSQLHAFRACFKIEFEIKQHLYCTKEFAEQKAHSVNF